MWRPTEFLKRHVLFAGFVAALVPLVALLGLQYVLLARLERVTAIAHRAALQNSLEAIETEIQGFYRSVSERALNLPAPIFTQGRIEKAAGWWRKSPVEGARRLFLVDFTQSPYGNYYFYNADRGKIEVAPASDEALAIIVAATPYQILIVKNGEDEAAAVRVEERDPEHRIILKPITDEASHVVGLTGLILDEVYFETVLLPGVVRKTLSSYFPDAEPVDLSVVLRDRAGKVILSLGGSEGGQEAIRRKIPFVFTDWTLALNSRSPSPERWARASFWYNITLSALLATVLIGGIVLALRAADRAVRLSAMKSDFVSNVSHELRTPLASIRVFAELLRMGRASAPEKAQEYGEYIEVESRRLSRLIDNILDFARIESGRKTYQFVPSDVEELVASTMKGFAVRIRKEGFHITYERPEAPLPTMSIDPDAISQALHNLLDNAVKYSNGEKEIGVSVGREGGSIVISVRDLGVGIPREEQRKIFDRFHRVSTGLVHNVKGTGLGLSIVHHIVQAHGGEVTLKSDPGKGSTFSIRLPIAEHPPRGNHAGLIPPAEPEASPDHGA